MYDTHKRYFYHLHATITLNYTPLLIHIHKEYANALWGLQGMDSKYTEVVEVVRVLGDKLRQEPAKLRFSAQVSILVTYVIYVPTIHTVYTHTVYTHSV